jgi:hypothetical protein
MVRALREFEGWRCLWRIPLAGLLLAAVPLALVAVIVGAAAIGGDGFDLLMRIFAAGVTVVGSTYLYPRFARQQLHVKLIANRLQTWEQANPHTYVEVLVRDTEIYRAKRTLRKAGFNPGHFLTRLGTTPPDAPDLNVKIGVEEPAMHKQSSSAEDRVGRIVGALDAAGVRARISGTDVPHRIAA